MLRYRIIVFLQSDPALGLDQNAHFNNQFIIPGAYWGSGTGIISQTDPTRVQNPRRVPLMNHFTNP